MIVVLTLQGEDPDPTVIKLKDEAAGFQLLNDISGVI